MIVRICLLILLPTIAYSSLFDSPVGPYWFTFKRCEKCPKDGTREMVFDYHLRKVNRTVVVLYGNITLKRTLDYSIKMKNEFSVWGNGGWRSNAHHMDFNGKVCKSFRMLLGKLTDTFWSKMGIDISKTNCIIPAGNYVLDDYDVSDWYFKPMPVLPYGLYRMTSYLYSAEDELLGCLRIIIEIRRRY